MRCLNGGLRLFWHSSSFGYSKTDVLDGDKVVCFGTLPVLGIVKRE